MTNLHPDTFAIFEYAKMAKAIDHMWWTSGPVHGVGPNLLAMAVGCKGWTYSYIKPLLDSAKSIAPQAISEPLKNGTHRWNRMIVVDGISVYMGVLLFDKVCKEYGLTTDSKTTDTSFHGITEEQIDRAAKNYRKKQLAMINRNSRNTWKLDDPERHFVAWVEEDDAFKAGVRWALNQLSKGKERMHYIIKRVPRIQPTNKFGVPNKTTYLWDYKNITYLKGNGEWTRDKYSARVFEGTWNDARSEAARARICCSDPNGPEFIGPVEAVLNEDGTINHTNEH